MGLQGGHIERPRLLAVDGDVIYGGRRQRWWRSSSRTRHARGTRVHRAAHLSRHVAAHHHTRTQAHAGTGQAVRRGGRIVNGARRFVLRVRLQITDGRNRPTLVDRFFNFFRKTNILHLHFAKLDTHALKVGGNSLAQHGAHHGNFRFHVDNRKPQFGHHFLDAQPDLAAQIFLNLVGGEATFRAGNVLDENTGVLDANCVDTKRGRTDDTEFFVAHRRGSRRAPFQIGKFARVDEIHFGLERRFEAVFPAVESGQNRHVLRGQCVHAGLVNVGQLAFVDEDRHLTFTHGEFGTVLDFVIHPLETVHQRVVRIVEPFDDINQFTSQFFPEVNHVVVLR